MGFAVGIERSVWRRARVQDNTASWISRSLIRELTDVAEGLGDVVNRHWLGEVAGNDVGAFQHRAHFRQRGQGATRSLRKLEALLLPEQPVNKAIQLLAPDQRDARKAFPGSRNVNTQQSERRAPFLMVGKPIPQPHNQCRQQLVDRVETVEYG